MLRPSACDTVLVDRTPGFEHGAMWEIEHIRQPPWRTERARDSPDDSTLFHSLDAE